MSTNERRPAMDEARKRATWNASAVDEIRALQEPGDGDLVAELVETFRGDAAVLVERLERVAAAFDFEAVHEIAHRIKGGALNLGGERLAHAAAGLESAAIRRDAPAIGALVKALIAERDHFFAAASSR